MIDARAQILANIRRAYHQAGDEATRRQSVSDRLTQHARGPVPASSDPLLQGFTTQLEAVAGSLVRVNSATAVVQAVSDYIKQQALPPSLVVAPDPVLDALPWPEELTAERRPIHKGDTVAITRAYGGVAETGSLVMTASAQTPTLLNFLPDHFICLLPAERVVSHLDDVWVLLRRERDDMPRTLNFITGPSRTADVEQTIQLGAHGPRSLLVILWER